MKKALLFCATLTIMMAVTACGAGTPVDTSVTSTTAASSDTYKVAEDEDDFTDVTLEMICKDYLGERKWEDTLYKESKDGFIRVAYFMHSPYTDLVCPQAVYPSADWTTYEIATSWSDQTAPWVTRNTGNDAYFLWSPDYRYCFCVDDGWLMINGVKSWLMGPRADSLDPLDLVNDFQSGKWDGSKIWSADGATCAEVLYDGEIIYRYEAFTYGDYGDDKITAKAWRNFGTTMPKIFFSGEKLEWQNYNREDSWLPDGRDVYTSKTAQLLSGVNVHFPNGRLSDEMLHYTAFGVNVPAERDAYAITTSGIFCYHAGQILNSWPCDIESNPMLSYSIWRDHSDNGNNGDNWEYYAELGDKIVKLEADGTMTTKLTNVIKEFVGDGCVVGHLTLEDGRLGFHTEYGDYFPDNAPIIISDQVESYYTSPYLDAVLFRKDDGYTCIVDGDELFQNAAGHGALWIYSLGTESPEFYAIRYIEYFVKYHDSTMAYKELLNDCAN